MDHNIRRALTRAKASGQLLPVLLEIIEELKIEDQRSIFKIARFHYERGLNKYYGVAVKWLSDEAIADRVKESWLRRRRGRADDGRRLVADLLLEEAEFRGIKTEEQLFWEEVAKATPAGRAKHIPRVVMYLPKCSERGGHSFMFVEQYICINCNEKVDREKVDGIVARRSLVWLRKLTS